MLVDPPTGMVPPTGLNQLWKSIMDVRNPDGRVHIKAETFNLLHVMINDLQTVQTRLDSMAAQ